MLKENVGNYVVATFLVGTQSTTSWEGILYDVGNDYMTIYQEGRDRYIVSDIYSLKFIEFYDTRCRDICDEVLRSGWMPNQGCEKNSCGGRGDVLKSGISTSERKHPHGFCETGRGALFSAEIQRPPRGGGEALRRAGGRPQCPHCP